MLIIKYTNEGIVVSDAKAEEWAKEIIKTYLSFTDEDMTIPVGTAVMISAIRLSVLEGLIPHTEIEFKFNGELLGLNKYANIEKWPKGFCDVETSFIGRILRLQIDKRKEEKANGESSKQN